MPMEDSYWEQMKSPIADMKNTGGRMGGAITAALFLREFVDTDKVSYMSFYLRVEGLIVGIYVLGFMPAVQAGSYICTQYEFLAHGVLWTS